MAENFPDPLLTAVADGINGWGFSDGFPFFGPTGGTGPGIAGNTNFESFGQLIGTLNTAFAAAVPNGSTQFVLLTNSGPTNDNPIFVSLKGGTPIEFLLDSNADTGAAVTAGTDGANAFVLTTPDGIATLFNLTNISVVPSATNYTQTLAATCTPTPSVKRAGTKRLAATNTSLGAISRGTTHILAAINAAAGSLRRAATHNLAATSTPTPMVARDLGHAVVVSTTPAGSLRRAVALVLATTTSPSGTINRAATHTMAVINAAASTMQRGAGHAFTVANVALGAIVRAAGHALTGSTSPAGAVSRAATKDLSGSTVPAGSIARHLAASVTLAGTTTPTPSVNKGFTPILAVTTQPEAALRLNVSPAFPPVPVAAQPSLARGVTIPLVGSVTPVASVARHLAAQVVFRALAIVAPSIAARLFHLPDECSIVTLPAQDTVIMFETCELKTGQFPARYTPESRLYGMDFSRRLDGGEVIDVPDVNLMDGDIVISDVQSNDTTVTFRLTGGSPIYQRLAIRVTTTATPPNIYQGEATIACYP